MLNSYTGSDCASYSTFKMPSSPASTVCVLITGLSFCRNVINHFTLAMETETVGVYQTLAELRLQTILIPAT